jgi:hypothetical protein
MCVISLRRWRLSPKIRYQEVDRPTYTKIDLANRVREDGFAVGVAR